MEDWTENLDYNISLMTTAIELAKNPELRDIFLDLASRDDFTNPVAWCREAHLKDTDWGAKALVYFFKTLNKNCCELVEFQDQGWFTTKICGFPKMRLTKEGQILAEMLHASKEKMGK